jgi:hypothetical protein
MWSFLVALVLKTQSRQRESLFGAGTLVTAEAAAVSVRG